MKPVNRMPSPRRRKIRGKLFVRQSGICGLCDQEMEGDEATLDHILPIARGGTNAQENLHVVHKLCNQLKGDARGPWKLKLELVT